MKATIDQISLDHKTMKYMLYLNYCGNQNRIGITHDEAASIIESGDCDIVIHEKKTFWIPKP